MKMRHDDVAAELSRLSADQEYAKLRATGMPSPEAIQRVIKQMIDPHAPQPEDIHQELQMFERMAADPNMLRQGLTNLPPQRLMDLPPEYQAQLPMPNQNGSMPTTPHPLEEMKALLDEEVYPATDSGIGHAYDDALKQELLRGTIPGHFYQWEPPDYSIPPGFPPLGGGNQGWYPGSGPIDQGRPMDDMYSYPVEDKGS